MDTDVIAQHYTKMVVLGGTFQIGDLYDYRNDRIVTGRPCWDSDEIARASTIRDQFTLKIKSPDSGSTSNKRENVGLDEHLQASVMAGLIEKYRGAAKYLSNRASPLEASQVLICRAKSRKVSLDLQTLMSQDVPHLVESKKEVESSTSKTLPTHVVVGVTYGAEAYCVLALESDEDAQEKDQEYLSEIASKMEAAFSKSLDFYGFKDLFNEEERKQLTRIKCRLYVDLQTSPFQEGSVFSTFKQCHKLIEQVRKGDIRNKKIVPIAVLLCPLKAIMGPAVGVYPEYQDVDSELLDRCCRTWEALDSICAKSVAIRTKNKKASPASLRQFEKALDKYKQLVQKAFGSSVVEARQTGKEDEIERVAKIAENHAIFKPSRLERWLRFKQAEYEMSCKIGSITEIECLANEKELEKNLAVSFNKKYSVVLRIPPLDELTNKTLENMKEYVASYKKLTPVRDDDEDTDEGSTDDEDEDEEDGDDVPWHMLKRNQKPVLARIQELADHLEKNQHIEKHVEFLIVFGDADEKFGCRYSVYETGRLLRDNLNQLPRPPTGLRIRPPKTRPARKTTSTYAIDLEWDYEDLGFPCHFLVEYRLDGNKDEVWTQRKTTKSGETQLAIPYTSGSAMTIRVAADTCIGRSEFSEVVDTATVRELNEDQEAIHEKEFLVSKSETYVDPKNEEEMDRSRKTEPAATSMSTSQQPIETKNAETILLSTSHVVTSDTPRKGWKAPDSTNMSMNEEPMLGMDQENEFGDHMTDDSDEDDCEVVSLEDDDGNDEISQVEEETSNTAIEEHVTKMVVLEGGFQVGDLYDYRSDRILTDGRKYWESRKIGSLIKVNNNFSLEFECSDSSTMNNKMENMGLHEHFQASFMAGLIEKPRGGSRYLTYCCSSSQAAQVLICRVESKVTQLDLQNLAIEDVTHLYDTWKKTKSSKSKTNPTHIVVGVTYGAEAYCVLTQDLKDAETDDDSREEAEQFLSNIANKMENALEEELNLAEFKQQFDMNEKKQLSNIKCYLYTDLQTGVVQECSVPDVYKHFLKFTQQVKKTGNGNNKSIPIAVSLCPLQAIMEHDEGGQFEFHDVDPELISRCVRIWDELDQVCAKSVVIRTANKKVDKSSLRQFEEAVGKYKSLMQTSLKKGIAKARETGQQSEIEKAAKITENHSIFKPSQLVQWLLYKQGECKMYEKISKMAKNLQLASKKTVEKELGEAFEIKFTMVLGLPSLTQRTNKILQAMKEYTDSYDTLVAYNEDEDENETDDNVEEDSNRPWNQQTQKYVLSKVREFAEHVEKNKHLENQVQFFMTFCETDKDVGCRYSVYDAPRLLKDNISQLPQPPTGLRVHAPKMSNPQKRNIVVAWDYAELGFPCYFLAEYRRCDGNDETWTQKKTTKPRETQITIPYKTRSAIEFRVAADTCIGRSEFSEVINTESEWDAVDDEETSSDTVSMYSEAGSAEFSRRSEMRKTGTAASLQTSQSSKKNIRGAIKPPTDVEVETVTQSTAELGWVTSATENKSVSYRVRYWQYGQDESQANELEVAVGESCCRLEGLLPETTYKINIVAVSNGGREMSEPSETLHLTTVHQHVRFAETMANRGIKIGDRNGMDLLAVPLTKSPRSNSTVERFVFGKQSSGAGKVQHKTILVMGATGAGKTTLINGMINYIFNVEWDDKFRFQLIREQLVGSSQSQSQTSGITAYDIYHTEGFRIPYSLTIVDTPGYGDTKGLDRDKEITEMIRKFFEDKSGIQNLDIIGFVAQASLPRLTPTQIYIFDSVLSIFGKDVEENIDFLLTFADGQNPPILSAIAEAGLPYPKEPGTGLPRHHKFNNSGFFCSNRESGSDASNTAEKFNHFFWRMGMENFQRFFSTLAAMKTKSLSLTKQVLEERRRLEATVEGLQPLIKTGLTKMEEMRKTKQVITNSQAQIDANENVEIEVEVHEAVQVKYDGGCLTNCNKCHVTCHVPCYLGNTENKLNCAAMDNSMPAETRSCTVCPQKCIWNLHENQPYKWEYVKRKKTTSSDAIKEKYEAEMNRKLTAQQLVEVLERDVQKNDAEVLQQVETVTQCIKRLEEIALRPNPFSTPQYIDLIIDAEQQEKRQGYKERIESLKKLRKMAVITSKIKNNENLMSLDRKDDYEAQTESDEGDDNETVNAYDDDDDNMSLQSAQTDHSKFQKFTKLFSFQK